MTTDIEQARAVLARKHRVPPADLRYVGEWDTGWQDRRFWMFNILRPGHPRHKSTVVAEMPAAGKNIQ